MALSARVAPTAFLVSACASFQVCNTGDGAGRRSLGHTPGGRVPAAGLKTDSRPLCLGLPAAAPVLSFLTWRDGKPKMQAWEAPVQAGLLPLGLWKGLWLFCLDNRSLADWFFF